MAKWYLEGYLTGQDSVYRVPLDMFPTIVGRQDDVGLTLPSSSVSRMHAEFISRDDQLVLRDLGSTNGTFVNHQAITEESILADGDVIKFADIEFRLCRETVDDDAIPSLDSCSTCILSNSDQFNRLPIGARELEQLLQDKLVTPVYQPIVATDGEKTVGMELLGRGCHELLSASPFELFFLADSLSKSVELSELIRDVGVEHWATSTCSQLPLFLNTHPDELLDCQHLLASLENLKRCFPDIPLVLEIHEQAVTNQAMLASLTNALDALEIRLAYDDFGAGQARLLELLTIPPYVVKFDIALIRDLDKAPKSRLEMIGLLVELVKKGGTLTLAEGVSHKGTLAICKTLGFDLIQGYVYGKPKKIDDIIKQNN